MAFKFTRGNTDPFGAMQTKGLINTPPTNPNNPKTPEELAKEAKAKAQSSEKVLLNPGEAGYDPTKKASYVQKGSATIPTPFTKEGNEAYANLSQEEKDAQDKKWEEIQEKKAKIYSYEDKEEEVVKDPGEEPTKKWIYTSTTENPRTTKTQDFLEGKSVQMFAPSHDYRMPGLSNVISHAIGKTPKGRKDVTLFGMKNKPISGKRYEEAAAAYDKTVEAARKRRGGEKDARITTQEQQEYVDKYGIMPNKFGAGRSLLYDPATNIGQTNPNQTFMKDAKGSMRKLNKKRRKFVNPVSTSPSNDPSAPPLKQPTGANALDASGRPVRIMTQSFRKT